MSLFKRRNYKLLYSLLVVLPAVAVTSISLHFDVEPLFVSKAVVRAVVLNSIALAVKLHDPTPPVLQASLGPNRISAVNSMSDAPEKMSSLISSFFPNKNIVIISLDNKPFIRSRFAFGYQPATDVKLISLHDKFQLAKLKIPTENDFEQLIAISNWVHGQWSHGTSGAKEFCPSDFNADKILTLAHHGYRFWCHVYSMTFIQVAASLGYQARLVSLTKDGYESNDMHAVAEVWSNYYGKWITVDTDFNIWYTRDGIPLSVLEIHNLLLSNDIDSIKVIKGIRRPQPEFESRIPTLYNYYKYFYVDMRNDWLSNKYFPGHPSRSDKATLFWIDRRLPRVLSIRTAVFDKSDLYWDLNRTYLTFGDSDSRAKEVSVRLSTVTPNFSHFEISMNGGPSMKVVSSTLIWKIHEGENVISVYSVNNAGLKGIASRLAIVVGQN